LSEAVVRARVLKRLAQDASLSDVQVIVHVADTPRLEVLRGGQLIAERRFESFPASCNARRDAIAVAVALAIERAREVEAAATADASTPAATPATATASATTEAAPSSAATPPEQASAPSEAASAQEPAEPVEEASDDGSSALELGAHVGAAALLEILPGLATAAVLGADVAFGDVRVSVSGLASLDQSDDVLGASIDSRLILGRALVCGDLTRLGDVAFEGCAGALAGAVFASGDGYDTDRSTELAYVAALARAALRFPARRALAGRLALDGLVPVVRPSYLLREAPGDGTTAITPAPIGASLALEIVLTLP
jgi:hypothetical protein